MDYVRVRSGLYRSVDHRVEIERHIDEETYYRSSKIHYKKVTNWAVRIDGKEVFALDTKKDAMEWVLFKLGQRVSP